MEIKVPAKIILLGEHSVVYPRNSAILTTIDLYATFNSKLNRKKIFKIISTQYKSEFEINTEDAISYYKKAKILHEAFLISNNINELSKFVNDGMNFFKIILGLLAEKYPITKFITLKIDSDIPIGSGLGSSAVMAVGVIKSVLLQNKIKFSDETLFNLAKSIENFQHGKSSGADPACIISGGLILYEHKENGEKKFSKIKASQKIFKNMHLIFTGKPKETTGEIVNFVSKNDLKFEIFEQIQKLIKQIQKDDFSNIDQAIDKNGLLLEKLGIVNHQTLEFFKKIREQGGFCKISGAGGISAQGSGLALVFQKKSNDLKALITENNFTVIPL